MTLLPVTTSPPIYHGVVRSVATLPGREVTQNARLFAAVTQATDREPSWTPCIETPMHPEYPCAHCIVSGAVGTVLHAEIGTGPMPTLTTTSVTADGAARSWSTVDDFTQEVVQERIYDGVPYRNSTEVGTAMGKQVGALAVAKYLRSSE